MGLALPFQESGSVWKEKKGIWCEMGSVCCWRKWSRLSIQGEPDYHWKNDMDRCWLSYLKKKALNSLAECVRVCALVKGSHAYDGDARIRFVNLGFVSEGLFPNWSFYGKSRNRIRISETGSCVLHEQRVYVTPDFGTARTMMNRFVLIGYESDEEEEIKVRTVLLLFRRVV